MQTINLNLIPGTISPVAHANQDDVRLPIAFPIYDGDEEYTIPTDAVVSVQGTKPDTKSFLYKSSTDPDVVSFSGSTITLYTHQQMTIVDGKFPCEFSIAADGATLHTLNFILDIEKGTLPSDADLSETDITAIKQAIAAGEKMDALQEKLDKAEELVAQVDKDVESAITSATNAKTSEANAEASATSAATSETNAKTSEANAFKSATAAASSASNASASATAAKTSETNASASATAASASETNAKTSETNASASATAASTSETNAKTSETNAAASATAAKNSQSSASGYATQAKNQATNAQTSATNAASSEANAQTSATSAAQSASEAKASAENNEKWAKQSESYAVGGTSTRTGEDEDNSKYYKDLAKQYAAQAQAAVTGVSFTIVTSLPATGADGVFYLIAHEHGSGDSYDEYVWLKDQQKFERIGTTDVDLTDYVKRSDTATTAQAGTMSASDKAKLDGIATGATKVTVDDALSATSSNPVSSKAIQSALDAMDEAIETKADSTTVAAIDKRVTTAEGKISAVESTLTTKVDTTTVIALEERVSTNEDAISTINSVVPTKADKTDVDDLTEVVTAIGTEVSARPSTRKLSTQTLTAEGGTLTWTDSCITDDSLIDVYASIANIAPSEITQSGTTVTVTFDAQDADFQVAIVVMN